VLGGQDESRENPGHLCAENPSKFTNTMNVHWSGLKRTSDSYPRLGKWNLISVPIKECPAYNRLRTTLFIGALQRVRKKT
jgi:hypothetical protein